MNGHLFCRCAGQGKHCSLTHGLIVGSLVARVTHAIYAEVLEQDMREPLVLQRLSLVPTPAHTGKVVDGLPSSYEKANGGIDDVPKLPLCQFTPAVLDDLHLGI